MKLRKNLINGIIVEKIRMHPSGSFLLWVKLTFRLFDYWIFFSFFQCNENVPIFYVLEWTAEPTAKNFVFGRADGLMDFTERQLLIKKNHSLWDSYIQIG